MAQNQPIPTDQTITPGNDFYDYVNQAWLSQHDIPADKAQIDYWTKLSDTLLLQLRELLTLEGQASSLDIGLARQFYKSGMDVAAIEAEDAQPVHAWFDTIANLQTAADIIGYIAQVHGRGHSMAWDVSIDLDNKDSSQYLPYIYQDGLSLPDRDYYLEAGERFDSVRQAYQKYLQELFGLLGFDQGQQRSQHVYELEAAMAQASQTALETHDDVANYHLYNTADLAESFPAVDWPNYLAATGLSDAASIIIAQPDFLKAVLELIATKPIADWRDYLLVHTVQPYLTTLPQRFVDLHFGFFRATLNGIEKQQERYKTIVQRAVIELPQPVGRLYIQDHFSQDDKTAIQDLVGHLQTALRKRIGRLDWMSTGTKQAAYEKLNTFLPLLGYPDNWRQYDGLKFADSYFENVCRLNDHEWQYDLERLHNTVDRHEWFTSPAIINAFYWPNVNTITFPAGILQPPFFDASGDFAANYGAIGAVIGHEISHGYDNHGSEYDKDGNMRSWWTEQDRKTFDDKAARLAKQFDGYEIEGRQVNGKLTLGENIGDLGGILAAYDAMEAYIAEHPDAAQPVDGQTPAQRFFTAYATTWCGKKRPEIRLRYLLSDPHAPDKLRVNGVVTNVDAWYDAFDIKPGDQLYQKPEDRVRIW